MPDDNNIEFNLIFPESNGYSKSPEMVTKRIVPHLNQLEPGAKLE